ncbi:hypothetical protein XENOCAPTIV_008339 [Xenoophorus captivus]|uniref:Uncharacterized protein n=1 Tax=Xenoophorus captivus TaxID=1517983 RepID=A0ABV0QZ93_9TELE
MRIPAKVTKEVIPAIIKPFHLPKVAVNQSDKESATVRMPGCIIHPELWLLNHQDLLFGIKVQHKGPNMAQTPPFPANNMCKAILVCQDIRELEAFAYCSGHN